jgi:hypothetical protein
MNEDFAVISIMNQVISWVSLVTVLCFETFVFYKLKFKMDKAAIFLMIIYLAVITERLILDLVD